MVVILLQLDDLGIDETLDQAKHVGVGAALDLAHQASCRRSLRNSITLDAGQAVGQKLLRHIELAATDDIAIDVPVERAFLEISTQRAYLSSLT